MAKTLSQVVVVSSATKTAATTTRGRADCKGADGGFLTLRITNGGTAPTAQAVARIMVSHETSGTMPAAAAEGTGDGDWKQVYEMGGGTVSGQTTRQSWAFGPGVKFLQAEFPTHTGNDVTIEAVLTIYTY